MFPSTLGAVNVHFPAVWEKYEVISAGVYVLYV